MYAPCPLRNRHGGPLASGQSDRLTHATHPAAAGTRTRGAPLVNQGKALSTARSGDREVTVTAETMRAWAVERCAQIDEGPLALVERAVPSPGPGEVRLRVTACGVCRTDLHLAEGDVPPRRPGVVPGHEIVGTVDAVGAGVSHRRIGDRVGVAWLRATVRNCSRSPTTSRWKSPPSPTPSNAVPRRCATSPTAR